MPDKKPQILSKARRHLEQNKRSPYLLGDPSLAAQDDVVFCPLQSKKVSIIGKKSMLDLRLEKISLAHGNVDDIIFIKDKNHDYVSANERYTNIMQADRETIIGSNDHYIVPHALCSHHKMDTKAQTSYIDTFFEESNHVLKGNHLFILDAHYYFNQLNVFLTHKSPILGDNGQPIGVYCHAIHIKNPTVEMLKPYLDNNNIHITDFSLNNFNEGLLGKQDPYQLTQREAQCLALIVKGYSAKAIGKILAISHKTVEYHFSKIKYKIGCERKNQIIEKILAEGYASIYLKS